MFCTIDSFLLIIPIYVSNFREISCSLYYFWELNVQQIEAYFGYVLVGISLFLYTAIWIRLKNRPHHTNSEGKTFVPSPSSNSLQKPVTEQKSWNPHPLVLKSWKKIVLEIYQKDFSGYKSLTLKSEIPFFNCAFLIYLFWKWRRGCSNVCSLYFCCLELHWYLRQLCSYLAKWSIWMCLSYPQLLIFPCKVSAR